MRLDLSMKSLFGPLLIAAMLATAFGAASALAAAPAPAGAPKVAKPPIDIVADRLDTQNNDCVYTWTGSPEALRDTSRLRADIMIAHLEVMKDANKASKATKTSSTGTGSSAACGAVTNIEAKGHVYYVSTDGKRVHGDNAFWDATTTTMTITGDVVAVQGDNVMRGTKMVDNTETGEGHVEGSAKGPGAKNRPRAVLYPKETDDKNADGSAKQKPSK